MELGASSVLATLAICLASLALVLAKQLNVLNLGDDVARGLGSSVEWQRGLLLLTSVALAGAWLLPAGTIVVGLIAPHLTSAGGSTHESLIPTAAMMGNDCGAGGPAGADAFAPIELPCGLITIVGAPFFTC